MSANLYFSEKVRELPGFKSTPNGKGSGNNIVLDGISLIDGKGRLYSIWDENSPIPKGLVDLVEEITCYEYIPRMAPRELGIYRHESAECELVTETISGKPIYRAKGTTKKLEDFRALIHNIKIGSIRPDESYEGQQLGTSRIELERELKRVEEELKYLKEDTIPRFQQHLAASINTEHHLRKYLEEFSQSPDFSCFRFDVVKRLNAILNGI